MPDAINKATHYEDELVYVKPRDVENEISRQEKLKNWIIQVGYSYFKQPDAASICPQLVRLFARMEAELLTNSTTEEIIDYAFDEQCGFLGIGKHKEECLVDPLIAEYEAAKYLELTKEEKQLVTSFLDACVLMDEECSCYEII